MGWPMERDAKVMLCAVLVGVMEEGISRPENAIQRNQKDRDVTANQMENVIMAHVTALLDLEITSAVDQTGVDPGTVDAPPGITTVNITVLGLVKSMDVRFACRLPR